MTVPGLEPHARAVGVGERRRAAPSGGTGVRRSRRAAGAPPARPAPRGTGPTGASRSCAGRRRSSRGSRCALPAAAAPPSAAARRPRRESTWNSRSSVEVSTVELPGPARRLAGAGLIDARDGGDHGRSGTHDTERDRRRDGVVGRASVTAARASTTPAPVCGFQPVPTVWCALRRITSATWSACSAGFACSTSDAIADTIGAEKLVPCA